ncbi:malic enzyme-like NAD(P)-binding protein [Bradyrhizobium altum]|uniref:malic enzyme-like NAD(P)-binding protein n=1 Tax=Bradyrhizobium altum TaxID=1571202 RepID=UPI0028972D85|nr:malic enzyme-like NAD(P)-binding protein [Bradyrhizobium altum]
MLAGLFSALRVTGGGLTEQKLMFLGAEEAATGIADLVVTAMVGTGHFGGGSAALDLPDRFEGRRVNAHTDLGEIFLGADADLPQDNLSAALPHVREVSGYIATEVVPLADQRRLAAGRLPLDELPRLRSDVRRRIQ